MSYRQRGCLLFLGILCMSLGVCLTTKSGLGSSPIAAPSLVCSHALPWSFGTFIFLFNILLFAAQLALLGKRLGRLQYLQLPTIFLFSGCIDLYMAIFAELIPSSWLEAFFILSAAAVIMALGLTLSAAADLVVLPSIGMASALSIVTRAPFLPIRIATDTAFAALAVLLSYSFFDRLVCVGEGTLLSALFAARIAPLWLRLLTVRDEKNRLLFRPFARSSRRQ